MAPEGIEPADRAFQCFAGDGGAIFTRSAMAGRRYAAAMQAQVGTETWPDELLA